MSKFTGSIRIVNETGEPVFELPLDPDEIIEVLLRASQGLAVGTENVADVVAAAKKATANGGGTPLVMSKKRHKQLAGDSKTEKIIALLHEGVKPKEIAERLLTTAATVYAVKQRAKKAGEKFDPAAKKKRLAAQR